MILEAIEKVLSVHCSGADIRRIEAGGNVAQLWEAMRGAGFLDLCLPEQRGGAALPMIELCAVLQCLGRFAMPLPLAQTIVAGALAGGATELPAGMLTLAGRLQHLGATGVACPATPYGAIADYVLVADDGDLLLLDCAQASRVSAGDPRHLGASLHWDTLRPQMRIPGAGEAVEPFAAAMSSALLSGAMQRSFDMSLAHCNDRVQFGKALGKFQAIQQQLSVMAEHVLAGTIAAESAFRTKAAAPNRLAAAIAKSRTSEAAGLVAGIAHAVHGAIGMTDEYDLGLLTRRLHDWRIGYGAEHYWNRIVGTLVLSSPGSLAEFVRST